MQPGASHDYSIVEHLAVTLTVSVKDPAGHVAEATLWCIRCALQGQRDADKVGMGGARCVKGDNHTHPHTDTMRASARHPGFALCNHL